MFKEWKSNSMRLNAIAGQSTLYEGLFETFSFLIFIKWTIIVNVSEMFFMVHIANNECFLYHANLLF